MLLSRTTNSRRSYGRWSDSYLSEMRIFRTNVVVIAAVGLKMTSSTEVLGTRASKVSNLINWFNLRILNTKVSKRASTATTLFARESYLLSKNSTKRCWRIKPSFLAMSSPPSFSINPRIRCNLSLEGKPISFSANVQVSLALLIFVIDYWDGENIVPIKKEFANHIKDILFQWQAQDFVAIAFAYKPVTPDIQEWIQNSE